MFRGDHALNSLVSAKRRILGTNITEEEYNSLNKELADIKFTLEAAYKRGKNEQNTLVKQVTIDALERLIQNLKDIK